MVAVESLIGSNLNVAKVQYHVLLQKQLLCKMSSMRIVRECIVLKRVTFVRGALIAKSCIAQHNCPHLQKVYLHCPTIQLAKLSLLAHSQLCSKVQVHVILSQLCRVQVHTIVQGKSTVNCAAGFKGTCDCALCQNCATDVTAT